MPVIRVFGCWHTSWPWNRGCSCTVPPLALGSLVADVLQNLLFFLGRYTSCYSSFGLFVGGLAHTRTHAQSHIEDRLHQIRTQHAHQLLQEILNV